MVTMYTLGKRRAWQYKQAKYVILMLYLSWIASPMIVRVCLF